MERVKDSWARVGAVTGLVCCCYGLAYGLWMAHRQDEARYKQAMEFSFAKKYGLDNKPIKVIRLGKPGNSYLPLPWDRYGMSTLDLFTKPR